jgi:hypothetical protein
MDRIIDNEIQHFLDDDIGDSGRLQFIRKSLAQDKPLYNSDRKFLLMLFEKYSVDDGISHRLHYLNPKSEPPQIIIKKPRKKMTPKIQILIVIIVTATVYFIIHPNLLTICHELSSDISQCALFSELFNLTAIHIQSGTIWNTGNGIGSWTGTVDGLEENTGFLIKENLGFIFFFIIIPSLVILGILLNGKRKCLI